MLWLRIDLRTLQVSSLNWPRWRERISIFSTGPKKQLHTTANCRFLSIPCALPGRRSNRRTTLSRGALMNSVTGPSLTSFCILLTKRLTQAFRVGGFLNGLSFTRKSIRSGSQSIAHISAANTPAIQARIRRLMAGARRRRYDNAGTFRKKYLSGLERSPCSFNRIINLPKS
jgi:hypothetical protein